MKSIRVYSWKPKDTINFGDEIGPMIVRELCLRQGLDLEILPTVSSALPKLLAVGSVLHEARDGDLVWGTGVNSKTRLNFAQAAKVGITAVRGPLTRAVVMDHGLACPAVYGDPGLLFPMLFDDRIRTRRAELEADCALLGLRMPETVFLPNINDDRFLPDHVRTGDCPEVMVVRPNLDPITVAAFVSAASRVLSSSLHGLVFADAYHRSTVRVVSQYEPEFKYSDYYLGTGRRPPPAYATLTEALTGEAAHPLNWDPRPLLEAFPLASEEGRTALETYTPELHSDEVLQVSDLSSEKSPFRDGWAEPEDGRIWTVGHWAKLRFVPCGPAAGRGVLRMKVGTLPKGKESYELLRVMHRDTVLSTYRITRDGDQVDIEIPIPDMGSDREVMLSFRLEHPSKPKDFGIGADDRLLGICVSELVLVPRRVGGAR